MQTFESSILITAYNRRKTTEECLSNLFENGINQWAEIIVVDDNSTDGTGDRVRSLWPEVKLIEGSGNLWWGGGMQLAMETASHSGTTLIWLNDDCRPRPGILRQLHDYSIESGAIAVSHSLTERGEIYGGFMKTKFGVRRVAAAAEEVLSVDTFHGNCVVIPRHVFEKIGPIDGKSFVQNCGDLDYGFRARSAGFKILLPGWARCDNDHNFTPSKQLSWTTAECSFSEIHREMYSVRSNLHWRTRRLFYTRHWGWIWGLFLAVKPYPIFYSMWTIASIFGRGNLQKIRQLVHRVLLCSRDE